MPQGSVEFLSLPFGKSHVKYEAHVVVASGIDEGTVLIGLRQLLDGGEGFAVVFHFTEHDVVPVIGGMC